jgi:excisionase family DNA binding protein
LASVEGELRRGAMISTQACPESTDLLTVPEAAAFLRLKVSTIRSWVLKRRIPYVKLGGRVLIRKVDLEALIEKSFVPAEPLRVPALASE